MRGTLKCKVGVRESSKVFCISKGLRTWCNGEFRIDESVNIFVWYCAG